MTRSSARILALLMTLVLVPGCGYRSGGAGDGKGSAAAADRGAANGGYRWRSLYRADVSTVAVPILENASYYRGVEFDLTKAIIHEVELSTPYKVVPRERADTVLEGRVVAVDVSTLSADRDSSVPQEQLLALTVSFVWKDLRTGQILVDRRNFEQTAVYYPTLGEGRFVGQMQAVDRLADAVVQELQSDW